MKSIAFLFLAAATLTLGLSSCEKCSTCSYSYKLAGTDTSRTFPETCGTDKELNNYEIMARQEAALDNGAVPTCTRK